jgi:hypothetical protein
MYIEKIKFERSGGFAGIILSTEIEMDDLPEDQKREIINLLDEADFDELPEKLSSKNPMPDEFIYSITAYSSEEEHSMLAGESSLPDDLQPLIEILVDIAKQRMRNKRQ